MPNMATILSRRGPARNSKLSGSGRDAILRKIGGSVVDLIRTSADTNERTDLFEREAGRP